MTAFASGASAGRLRLRELARPAAVIVALAAIVAARAVLARSTAVNPIVLGLLFGLALAGLALADGWRPTGRGVTVRAVGIGSAAGVGLALTALLGTHAHWLPGVAAGFPFGPWAVATVVVAGAEEALLRGALLDDLAPPLGLPAAIVATSLVFALMHVPVYGWVAVPLDLGVGLLFAGLRLLTGGVAAPAIAHAVADLAAFWL